MSLNMAQRACRVVEVFSLHMPKNPVFALQRASMFCKCFPFIWHRIMFLRSKESPCCGSVFLSYALESCFCAPKSLRVVEAFPFIWHRIMFLRSKESPCCESVFLSYALETCFCAPKSLHVVEVFFPSYTLESCFCRRIFYDLLSSHKSGVGRGVGWGWVLTFMYMFIHH